MVIPDCGHVFHEECLKNWIKVRLKCPNCNKSLEPDYGRGIGNDD